MINYRLTECSVLAAFCCIGLTCSPMGLVTNNPPNSKNQVSPADTLQNFPITDSVCLNDTDRIDFGSALDSIRDTLASVEESNDSIMVVESKTFLVATNKVRVAIVLNAPTVAVYSQGLIALKFSGASVQSPKKGKIFFQSSNKFRSPYVTAVSDNWTKTITLPCTLSTENESCFMCVNSTCYRGFLVLVTGENGKITVVNHLPMEEYLRGVVPLEIGKRTAVFIEALKAQAVAARTYAYKRLQDRRAFDYDMTNTISDQVYGGISVENQESDFAVQLTKDLILVYKDSIIAAYYHSTCGGQTASIEQVWDKRACDYLVSVSDLDSLGQAYCAASPAFIWEEKWNKSQLSTELINALRKIYPQQKFSGNVKDIIIENRLLCGRVKTCTIKGGHWSIQSGGDKVRFLFRRNCAGAPILRSSNFKVCSYKSHEIVFQGHGYGHGVGMCQTGALGRAQAGQSFEQILKAYYTGVTICTVFSAKNF